MTKTTRRTIIKAGIILAVALIFLSVLTIVSFSLVGEETAHAAGDIDYEKLSYVTVSNTNVRAFSALGPKIKATWAPDEIVDTEKEFIYLFFANKKNDEYTLGANFKIVDDGVDAANNLIESVWASKTPELEEGVKIHGNGYVIWNNAAVVDASATSSEIGGLISVNKGTIDNLVYYFSGNLYVTIHVNTVDTVIVGGMIAKNESSGKLINCRIEVGGGIVTETDKANATSYVGGLIGYNEGDIKYDSNSYLKFYTKKDPKTQKETRYNLNFEEDFPDDCFYKYESKSNVICSTSVETYSDREGASNTAIMNNLYAGGVVGYMYSGSITNTTIKYTGTTQVADQIGLYAEEGLVGDALGMIKQIPFVGDSLDTNTNYNDDEFVHPAGGIVGLLGDTGKLNNNQITLDGSVLSYGFAGSGDEASIAGGVIGLMESSCTSNASISGNYIKIGCSLTAFWVESFSIVNEIKNWISARTTNIYIGAFVGKCLKGEHTALTMNNNFLYIDKDNGIIEDGADYDSSAYNCKTGLVSGNTDFISFVGTNNWLARKLSECSTGRMAGNETNAGGFKHLCVFGDGDVEGKVENGTITVVAKPSHSPFRGYCSDMTIASPNWIRGEGNQITKTVNLNTQATSGLLFAVFIDEEIKSSGELTQLANDINLIKKPVWAKLNDPVDGENRFTCSVNNGVTLSWLKVKVAEDILVSKGTPVIEDFYGSIDGSDVDEEGNPIVHSISFAGGTQISHDYEQEDRTVMATGLFGTIKPGAKVSDLKVIFGGAINEVDGLEYKEYDGAGDALSAQEHVKVDRDNDGNYLDQNESGITRVKTRTKNKNSFNFESIISTLQEGRDKCHAYFLTGNGYNADADYNPGYLEIVPYFCEVVVDEHYIGILSGVNEGTILNVEVEGTKSCSVKCTANKVYFGTVCGLNKGSVTNVDAAMRGRALMKGRAEIFAGGMFGANEPASGASFSGLNAYVAGEIKLETSLEYFIATWYKYENATVVERPEDDKISTSDLSSPSGYEEVAYDYEYRTQESGENATTSLVKLYAFYVKDRKAVESVKISNYDPTQAAQALGALVGYQKSTGTVYTNSVAVAGNNSNFNSAVFQTDADAASVGSVIGFVNKESGNTVPTFNNVWAVLSSEEFDEDNPREYGRLILGNGSYSDVTNVNRVYVEYTVAIATINPLAPKPITFSLEPKENMTFSGWYDYTTGERQVITEGMLGTNYSPNVVANNLYKVELVNLLITDQKELKRISASTNEGRGYEGVEFFLGTNILLDSKFVPIGTEAHPFLGTLTGNGLSITVNGVDTLNGGTLAGLFGCVGESGTVKNLEVIISADIGSSSYTAAGAVAAINYGTIGQNRSTAKLYATIGKDITAKYVGGLVGVNYGTVLNAEATFLETGVVFAKHNGASSVAAYGGGAIGLNKSNATAKNIIVSCRDVDTLDSPINSNMETCALGGVIGYNEDTAKAYSLVSIVNAGNVIGEDFGSYALEGVYLGMIIGYNDSDDVDALWCLYLAKEQTDNSSFGEPVAVYQGADEEPNVSDCVVLLSGKKHLTGNILIRYGYGRVTASIADLASGGKGGQISFLSQGTEQADFYDYVASFDSGERVTVQEGNIGYTFSPTIGTHRVEKGAPGEPSTVIDTAGLQGKVYFAGFAFSTIASQDDYKSLAKMVNDEAYQLYVNYNINASFILNDDSSAIGKDADHPFSGSINGNGYTVTLVSGVEHPFVGVLGRAGTSTSEIKNLRFNVQPGVLIEETSETNDLKRGFLTDVNNGIVSSLIMNVRGYLFNTKGYVGAIAGENNGEIRSTTFVIEYANYLGDSGFGMLYGKTVGGLAGLNNGKIGSTTPNSIDVTFAKNVLYDSKLYGGVLYGTNAAGGIVGENGKTGDICTTIVTLNGGTIVGDYASALVGINKGNISEAFVYLGNNVKYSAATAFGTVAGKNLGLIGSEETEEGSQDYPEKVKAFVYASPYFGAKLTFDEAKGVETSALSTLKIGGAVGVNDKAGTDTGILNGVFIELHASLIAATSAGGVAGENKGLIRNVSLSSTENAAISAAYSGGITAKNSGRILFVNGTLKGAVGSQTADVEKGIVTSQKTGGFVAEIIYTGTTYDGNNKLVGGSVTDSVVTLYGELFCDPSTGTAALAAADIPVEDEQFAYNAWVQVSNSASQPVGDPRTDAGFNVLRVLNDNLLTVAFNYENRRITFTSLAIVLNWYTDISTWGGKADGTTTYTPNLSSVNMDYYACYDDLRVTSATDLIKVSNLVNSHRYYRNVLFKMMGNINLDNTTILRPIGTEESPFSGIFDGGYYKIQFLTNGGISGVEYAGIFGYTSPESVIRNLTVNINENVYIGSVSSYEVAAMVGHSEGTLSSVFVSLASKIIHHASTMERTAYAGAFAGYVADSSTFENCWISILNDAAPSPVGNMSGTSAYGLNVIGVLGAGLTDLEFDLKNDENSRVKFFVPTNKGVDFDKFGDWYSDIGNGVLMSEDPSFVQGYAADKQNKNIYIVPNAGCEDVRVTLSFIELTISSKEDFIEFANNINTYGDQGAQFTLEADIEVEFDTCPSVGTADSPFTGRFDGKGHTITVKKDLIKRDYAGVFGYVGENGLVENLRIVADQSKFGDKSTLYSGIAVALLYGTIRDVVVEVSDHTVVYTTQGISSYGGIVGRAGKALVKDPVSGVITSGISYMIDNCWLVLSEGATVSNPVGEDDYYLQYRIDCGEGRVMRLVGEGALKVSFSENSGITFDASGEGDFYGFIDDNNKVDEKVTPKSDVGSTKKWTVYPIVYVKATGVFDENRIYYNSNGDRIEHPISEDFGTYYTIALKDKNGDDASNSMLCVHIDTVIQNQEDLEKLAENVRLGRNFRGITYELKNDIEIDGTYTPIGGVVTAADGSYYECEFIGGFDGKGYTVTFTEESLIDARFAGLFGKVGEYARIKSLTVVAEGRIGVDTGDNTTRSLYAGVLAGYAAGGTYKDVLVVLGRKASLYGATSIGRTFGYLPREAKNVAENCWAISYNSKENRNLNANEMDYNTAFDPASAAPESGINQGGVNNVLVEAAGVVTGDLSNEGFVFSYSSAYELEQGESLVVYRYRMEDSVLVSEEGETSFVASKLATRKGFIVSFLNKNISTLKDLNRFAMAVNDGYDLYGLTFDLQNDIAISGTDFKAIGNERYGMNGTFNGNGNTITLTAGTLIGGRYAGIFGSVASDGVVMNLRLVLAGTLGQNNVDEGVVATGEVNAKYAGAIAYNAGQLKNIVCISEDVELKVLSSISGAAYGLVIGHDETNLVSNVWALVDASSYVPSIGYVRGGDSGVNTMKIIGKGVVDAEMVSYLDEHSETSYKIKFYNKTTAIPVLGWYRSFEKNHQISSAMIAGLANGAEGELTAPVDSFGENFEVAVIKTNIENVEDYVAFARDVNIGGYTFETVTFTLSQNFTFTEVSFVSVGTYEHPFKGTFLGNDNTITYNTSNANKSIDGLFGNNYGTIRDLRFVVNGIVGENTSDTDRIYGAVAAVNRGTIERTLVNITSTGKVTGYSVGGLVGSNYGTITDCIAIVRGEIIGSSNKGRTVNVGGLVGINYGTIEGTDNFDNWSSSILPQDTRNGESYGMRANLFLYGKVSAKALTTEDIANAGGVVGNNASGSLLQYMIGYVMSGGVVKATSVAAEKSRAGGLVGYTVSFVNYNVIFTQGEITAEWGSGLEKEPSIAGGAVGYLNNVIAMSTWQVTTSNSQKATGKGNNSINTLIVKGGGKLKVAIDTTAQNTSILFTDITDDDGPELNGWYLAASYLREGAETPEWKATVAVEKDTTGNVGEGGSTFLPLKGLRNKTIIAIFVNTRIASVSDLADMADSVSAGLIGSVVFTLEEDIVIDKDHPLLSIIGNSECSFNNTFDGAYYTQATGVFDSEKTYYTVNGVKVENPTQEGFAAGQYYLLNYHTITFGKGAFDTVCKSNREVALFGYTGATSVIKNINIVVLGDETTPYVYGDESLDRMAILVAYAKGSIDRVSLTIQKGAEIKGKIVAGLVASFVAEDKKVSNVNYTLNGKITASAEDESNLIAAGLIGTSNGTLEWIDVTVGSDAVITAEGASAAYAATVVSENYNTIALTSVSFDGTVDVKGKMSAYSGIVSALNLGTIERVYVTVGSSGRFAEKESEYVEPISGSLTGNNMNLIKDSLVVASEANFSGKDSAVGQNKVAATWISNVWVYADMENFSRNESVNCITYDSDSGFSLSCPDAADVFAGKISFKGSIEPAEQAIALFANVMNEESNVGDGAAIKNVEYVGTDLRYVAYSATDENTENEVVIPKAIVGVKICLLARTEIGSGSEFVAFAQAVNSDRYDLSGVTFTLTSDIIIPATSELPGEVFSSIDLPSGVILEGGHKVITLNADTDLASVAPGDEQAIFSANAGTIRNIGLHLTSSDNALSLVNENAATGSIENAVVYLEKGVSLASKKYFAAKGTGSVVNGWLVVRDYDAASFSSVPYPVILIKGEGVLEQGGSDGLTFTAKEENDLLFVGYSLSGALIAGIDYTFDTAGKTEMYYTAEFLSLFVGTTEQLKAISEATALGYNGAGDTFTLTSDLILSEDLFGYDTAFTGKINGAGHTIKATAADSALFGKFSGELVQLHIDLADLLSGDATLFTSTASVKLTHVVITEERSTVHLGATLASGSSDVWIDSGNAALNNSFNASAYSLLYRTGEVSYLISDSLVTVTALDSEDQVFAGWYENGGVYAREKSTDLYLLGGKKIMLNCVNRLFTEVGDIEQLALAVTNGFSFAGETFTLYDGEIEIDTAIPTIGTAANHFKGAIVGGGKDAKITFSSSQVNPFIHTLEGELSGIFFDVKGSYAAGEAFVMNHSGTMRSVAISLSGANNTFVKGGTGDYNNCWVITASDYTILSGINQIYADKVTVTVEIEDGTLNFGFSQLAGTFLSLYEFDPTKSGLAIDPPENFDTNSMMYYSPESYEYVLGGARERDEVRFAVKGITSISDEREFLYLLYQANGDKLFVDAEGDAMEITMHGDENGNIELRGNYEIKLLADRLIFNLCGNALILTESVFRTVSTTKPGKICNGSIYIRSEDGVGDAGLVLENVTLFLQKDGIVLPSYELIAPVTIVTSDSTVVQVPSSGTYDFIYAPSGATVVASYDANNGYKVTHDGSNSEASGWYFIQIEDDEDHDNIKWARFAPKYISSEEDFKLFVYANNLDADRLAGKTIFLEKDISFAVTTDHILTTFKGIFDGQGKTITLTGGELSSAIFSVASAGSVRKLRLVIDSAVTVADKAISSDTGVKQNVAVVYYLANELDAIHTSSDAYVVNVFGQGEIAVTFQSNSVVFTAIETRVEGKRVALRKWADSNKTLIGEDKKPILTKTATATALCAYFEEAYHVVVMDQQGTVIDFTGSGDYFLEDLYDNLTPKSIRISLSFEDDLAVIGNGKLFLGLVLSGTYEGDSLTPVENEPLAFDITWKEGHYDILLQATVRDITMPWASETYAAKTFDYEDLLSGQYRKDFEANNALATAVGYTLEITYERMQGTPLLVEGKPYHAGEYRVIMTYKDGDHVMGVASCGLVIHKAKLTVKPNVNNKVYDGTKAATATGTPLSTGWLKTDALYVDIDIVGLFVFEDAYAGVAKKVFVQIDKIGLVAKGTPTEEKYKNVYLDYEVVIDDDCTATISRREVKIELASRTVDYLEQFDSGFATFGTTYYNLFRTNIGKAAFLNSVDANAYKAIAEKLLKVEETGALDVGYYRIFLDADALKKEEDPLLRNYSISLQGLNGEPYPYYIVQKSIVKLIFDDGATVYGSEFEPTFHCFEGVDNGVTYRKVQEMPVIEGVTFKEVLIPTGAAETYEFTYLFSLSNKNYTVSTTVYESVDGFSVPCLTGSVNVTVAPKPVQVEASGNEKLFGAEDGILRGRIYGNASLTEGHTLVVMRAEDGESVKEGGYRLTFKVVDEEGMDVTSYYDIKESNKTGYFLTIQPRTVSVRLNKQTVKYGTTSEAIIAAMNITVSAKGMTLLELCQALGGSKTEGDVDLKSDLGIDVSFDLPAEGYLPVGVYDPEPIIKLSGEAAKNIAIELIDVSDSVTVVARSITITITNNAKGTFSGKNEFNTNIAKLKNSYNLDSEDWTLVEDEGLEIVPDFYLVSGTGINAGTYKIDADFKLLYADGTEETENFLIQVVQGTYTVNPKAVTVQADVGYFDEDGTFNYAEDNTIYYGDSKAVLFFSSTDLGGFVSMSGTNKEVSDRIASELRIVYLKLARYLPYEQVKPLATSSNYNVTFKCDVTIAAVEFTIKLSSGEKAAGEPDPEIKWELIAKDAATGEVIENYLENVAPGTFDITVTADRTEGETLGTYVYSNVRVNIVNKALGASLMDEVTETGRTFAEYGYVEVDEPESLELVIKKPTGKSKVTEYLIYGFSIAGIAGLVVFLVIFLPKILKKRKLKKANLEEEEELAEKMAQSEGEGDSSEGKDAEEEGKESTEEDAPESKEDDQAEAPAESEISDEAPIAEEPVSEEVPDEAPNEESLSESSTDDLFSDTQPEEDNQ